MTVHSENASLIVDCIRLSVFISTFAVASSNSKILFPLNKALDKQMSCFSPTEKLSPSASTIVFKPWFNSLFLSSLAIRSFKWAFSKADHTSESSN